MLGRFAPRAAPSHDRHIVVEELIDRALAEDIGFCDLTSELVIPADARASSSSMRARISSPPGSRSPRGSSAATCRSAVSSCG